MGFSGQRQAVVFERALPVETDRQRLCLERDMSGEIGLRHAVQLETEFAFAAAGELILGNVRQEQGQNRLRAFTDDAAGQINVGVIELGWFALGLGLHRDVRSAGLAVHDQRSPGRMTVTLGNKREGDVERREARQMFRAGDAVGKPDKAACHA